MELQPKLVSDSFSEQVHIVTFSDLNGVSRLFGGMLTLWIDILAGVVARRHCGKQVTTAAVDSLNFVGPAYADEMITMKGKVTYVGKTSMEVCVRSYVEELSGHKRLINTAYMVMVALDENEKPTPVPGILLEREQDETDWEAGRRRYELRKQRRLEQY